MKPALLLVDIQNDYFPGGKMELVSIDLASANARILLDQLLRAGRPRAAGGHQGRRRVRQEPQTAWHGALAGAGGGGRSCSCHRVQHLTPLAKCGRPREPDGAVGEARCCPAHSH